MSTKQASIPDRISAVLPGPLRVVARALYHGLYYQPYIFIRHRILFRSWFFGLLFDLFVHDYKAEGCVFTIPKELTERSFRTRFLWDTYEREERRALARYLDPQATVLELGGCIGVVSCVTNCLLENPHNHVVVEANPTLIPCIETNRERNACRFQVEHCLASRTSNGDFFIHDLIVGGSANRQTGNKVTVPVLTVEEIETKHNLKFDTLIMDIEGGELAFIEENPQFLGQLQMVIMEVHPFIIGEEAIERCHARMIESGLTLVYHEAIQEIWVRR